MAAHLKFEEMLRTVGAILDENADTLALVDVSPQGIAFQAVGRGGQHELALSEIEIASARRAALRGHGGADAATGLSRFEWVLRLVGAELDRAGQSRYGLTVSRANVIVEGAEGYQRTFDAATLAQMLREAIQRRRPVPSRE